MERLITEGDTPKNRLASDELAAEAQARYRLEQNRVVIDPEDRRPYMEIVDWLVSLGRLSEV